MIYLHLPLFYALTKEVILRVDVLTPLMMHRVPAESYSGHVVHE
jgi:hypothetical protein